MSHHRTLALYCAGCCICLILAVPLQAQTFFEDRTESTIGRGWFVVGSVSFGDYDNDGDLDLYVTVGEFISIYAGLNTLFLNDGEGSFRDATTGEIDDEGEAYAVATGDIDNDGGLDIFQAAGGGPETIFRSVMLLNLGGGEFLDVLEGVGRLSRRADSLRTSHPLGKHRFPRQPGEWGNSPPDGRGAAGPLRTRCPDRICSGRSERPGWSAGRASCRRRRRHLAPTQRTVRPANTTAKSRRHLARAAGLLKVRDSLEKG